MVLTSSPVAGFYGLPAQGTWTLNVSDTYTPDAGRLDSWSISITAPAPSLSDAFSQWIGGFTELTEAQRAPTADPDGDGVPNLLEYVLAGHSPTASASCPSLCAAATAPGCLEYAINLRTGVDASNSTVWMCENLGAGTWTEVQDRGADIIVDRSTADRIVVRCRKTLPGIFLQLRVTGL